MSQEPTPALLSAEEVEQRFQDSFKPAPLNAEQQATYRRMSADHQKILAYVIEGRFENDEEEAKARQDLRTAEWALAEYAPRLLATLDAETARADAAERHNEGLRGQIAELQRLRAQEEVGRRELVARADAAVEREKALIEEVKAMLADPNKLYVNILRGGLSVEETRSLALRLLGDEGRTIRQLEAERPLLVETTARMQRIECGEKFYAMPIPSYNGILEALSPTLAQVEAEMKEGTDAAT